VRRLMRLTLTEASAPRSTALACTWMPRIKPARAAPVWRKAPPGPRVPPGSHVSPASRVPPPAGVAAVLRAGCAQQFHRKWVSPSPKSGLIVGWRDEKCAAPGSWG
jgi:hypothetical protein